MVAQADTLRWFTVLRLTRLSEQNSFLLGIGLNDAGQSLSLGATGAGVATLYVEPDSWKLRLARRNGACTFAVTTLDEALRILKNAVRQRAAVSVALEADVEETLRMLVSRGVRPHSVAVTDALSDGAVAMLQGLHTDVLSGAGLVVPPGSLRSTDVDGLLRDALNGKWEMQSREALSLQELVECDAEWLGGMDGSDAVADLSRDWLRVAMEFFPRDRTRFCWGRAVQDGPA